MSIVIAVLMGLFASIFLITRNSLKREEKRVSKIIEDMEAIQHPKDDLLRCKVDLCAALATASAIGAWLAGGIAFAALIYPFFLL